MVMLVKGMFHSDRGLGLMVMKGGRVTAYDMCNSFGFD